MAAAASSSRESVRRSFSCQSKQLSKFFLGPKQETENRAPRPRGQRGDLLSSVAFDHSEKERLAFRRIEGAEGPVQTTVTKNVRRIPVQVADLLLLLLQRYEEHSSVAAIAIDESVADRRVKIGAVPRRTARQHGQTGILHKILSFRRIVRQRERIAISANQKCIDFVRKIARLQSFDGPNGHLLTGERSVGRADCVVRLGD